MFGYYVLDTNISIPCGDLETAATTDAGIIDLSSTIIIHPGSKYLRIGRASDITPRTLLHAVARKRTKAALKVILRNIYQIYILLNCRPCRIRIVLYFQFTYSRM